MHSVHSMTEMCPYVSVDVRKYVLWQTYVFTDTIRKPGFDATLFHVGFVVDKVTLRQVFLRVRRCSWDQDSVVGMATCYRLYGSWLEPHWGQEYSIPATRPTQPPVKRSLGLFPGVKWLGRGVGQSHRLASRWVQWYRCAFMECYGEIFTFISVLPHTNASYSLSFISNWQHC